MMEMYEFQSRFRGISPLMANPALTLVNNMPVDVFAPDDTVPPEGTELALSHVYIFIYHFSCRR